MKSTKVLRNFLVIAIALLIGVFTFITVSNFSGSVASAVDGVETATIDIPDMDENFDDGCIMVAMNKATSEINKRYNVSYSSLWL